MSPTAAVEPVARAALGHASILDPSDTFVRRHIGPSDAEIQAMLDALGYRSLDEFTSAVVPEGIRLTRSLNLPGASHLRGEHETLAELKAIASKNQVFRSMIGMGYHDCITPPVILRNILENPGWYTQYTPYQAEISQGRLEALLNFQTMIADLTALPLAGASLLDEATAAGEAMSMCYASAGGHDCGKAFFVARDCHPQTISHLRTRAHFLKLDLVVGDPAAMDWSAKSYCGVLVQYPATDGRIVDYRPLFAEAKSRGALAVVAADLLSLAVLTPPGEFGADITLGNTQRFGVPMGFGGPHAAYIATKPEHARKLPGRIIGVSRDVQGHAAYRMAIQTREQHIRREKATSNICTAQALLAIIAGMFAVYHGPEGLRRIARRTHAYAAAIAGGLKRAGHEVLTDAFFDTIRVRPKGIGAAQVLAAARSKRINLRDFKDGTLGITTDETTSREDVVAVLSAFAAQGGTTPGIQDIDALAGGPTLPTAFARASGYLAHPVFNTHHSETEMLRYIFKLQGRDLSLAYSMIPLGSCTMKLNATTEMIPVTWPEFGRMHPFAPPEQAAGYREMFVRLEKWLAEATGFAAVSLQPNSGAQGEYSGLLAIRAYHESRGEAHRDVCLIPTSAHGTNPASAVVAGLRVVAVKCDDRGNIDLADLRARAAEHAKSLAALMVTYPSTHGVFEEGIKEICAIVHQHGGQVYMDGANMNAQVGLTSPGLIGADVCHLNLHKTFSIPHGGGGPGMGPIAVAQHLAPFLPSQGDEAGAPRAVGNVSAAPFGSASILTISYLYIALMGADGLKKATQVAMLNANYMARRLSEHYAVLYTGKNGRCAHEFILEFRPFETSAGIKVEDVAKRLQDYGFHAPTMSFPVPGTLMIEPTESESKEECDRLCEALIGIREEIADIEAGRMSRDDNPLRNAPHTFHMVSADEWKHPYSRRDGAFPRRAPWIRDNKFWPPVARIDNPYGDRNLVCVCPPMETLMGGA